MGRIHYLAARGLADARVTAVCSRDPAKRAGDWRATRGNFGPEPGAVDLTGVTAYESLDRLLADPDIDLIDVCTVTDQHAPIALAALDAGKHVLVEKPIALTPADADALVDAAKRAGRLLMVAHVLPFFPEFRYAAAAIAGGQYGRLLAAHFKRVIAKPDWSADIGDAAKTGGPAVDLHIHDTHFIGLVCGVPRRVFSVGAVESDVRESGSPHGTVEGGTVTYLTTSYLYGPGGPAVTCSSGALSMSGRPFAHGYEIYLERATLLYDSGGTPLTLLAADGTTTAPPLPRVAGSSEHDDGLHAFRAELQTAAAAVATGTEPNLLSGRLARDALVLCHREIESVKTGKVVPVG
jgi:predicted dehydrogenase